PLNIGENVRQMFTHPAVPLTARTSSAGSTPPCAHNRRSRLMPKDSAHPVSMRRTFAIISHPDAGKTTITERLLLMGKAIEVAGTVKSRKSDRHATSDWMAMEKQRGISVTTSVMQFPYQD